MFHRGKETRFAGALKAIHSIRKTANFYLIKRHGILIYDLNYYYICINSNDFMIYRYERKMSGFGIVAHRAAHFCQNTLIYLKGSGW